MRRSHLLPLRIAACALALALVRIPASSAAAASPFALASVGPNAGARVAATVTRTVGGAAVTLPAAMVPALQPGDVVEIRFPDYTRPPARANYHVNVAFITEAAPQHWLYEKSGPWDRLFSDARKRKTPFVPAPLRFVYGTADHRGIPIVFIVPEDAKTRGMDGVRDYVDAHPSDFKNMSESADDAVAKYSWFSDFLQSLAQDSLDPVSGEQRIEDVAVSLGAPAASVQACYTAGGTQAEIASCLQSTLLSVQYSTNIEAPTIAQFFGGVAGAAAPAQLALYLEPLLAIWHVFSQLGHQEYQYLPAALALDARDPGESLVGTQVPTLRPPGAQSSVLFFTIGDAQAAQDPPRVVDAAPSTGMCVRTPRVALPLHLDQTSPYVNDTTLVVRPDRGAPFSVPLDPRTLAAPVVDRAPLDRGATAETIALAGRYGFDPLQGERDAAAQVAFPHQAAWTIAPPADQPAIAGRSLDVVATSDAAPCLSSAALRIGDAPPIPLAVKPLDARRVELTASLKNVPPGRAEIDFAQDDPAHATRIATTVALAIAPSPAQVAGTSPPVANLGDPFVALSGSGFESVAAVTLDGATYKKTAGSTSRLACFAGPPIGGKGIEAGESVSAQLVGTDGAPGEVFVLRLGPARPAIASATISPQAPTYAANAPVDLTLRAAGALPALRAVRLRPAQPDATPCDAVADTGTSAAVPAGATYPLGGSALAVVARPDAVLGANAFGALQAQLVDAQTKAASAWVDLPGRFVRVPTVVKIEYTADPQAPCVLVGSDLFAIAGIEDATGRFVPPGYDCTSDLKNESCLVVPHVAHYALRLQDTGTTLTLPDGLVATPRS